MYLKYSLILFSTFIILSFSACNDKMDLAVQKEIEQAIEIGDKYTEYALSILDSVQENAELNET